MTILDEIIAQKRIEVEQRKAATPGTVAGTNARL